MIEDRSQSLGKYKIHEELGRGAFATVYRALDTTLDREVALKILHPQLLTDPTFVGRFKREARAMANLDHQHIATVYEIAEAKKRVYIAMQLASGLNLGSAISEQGRFAGKHALALLRPVCAALDYAHSKHLVHRDLKPSNVLLDKERGPMLTDFGFARLMGDSSVSLSLSGGILGTPAYIAPEVWELDKAGPPADVYALGCILYEMLTGEVLFAGRTPMQAMRAHDQGPQLPREWPEDVPEGIETVLEKALARDPRERYPSGMALWHALNDLETQAQAAEEAAQQAAVAAEWREETEAAMAAGEWSVAKMAVARWLALAPNDPDAQRAQAKIEKQLKGPPAEEEEKEEDPAQDTVDCTACGHVNRPGAQYCRACGHALEVQPESSPVTGASDKGLRWSFVLWWILANVVGWAVGGAVGDAVFSAVAGVVVGAVVGVSQWWILKSHIRRAGWWILTNTVGGAMGLVVGLTVGLEGTMFGAVFGAVLGAVGGVLQWWILKSHIRRAGWWILANVVGWAVAVGGAGAVGKAVGWAVAEAVSGLVVGIVTGPVLFWLLKNHKIIPPNKLASAQ